MSLELEEFKKKYNEVLAIEKKAEDFFNNPNEAMKRKMAAENFSTPIDIVKKW